MNRLFLRRGDYISKMLLVLTFNRDAFLELLTKLVEWYCDPWNVSSPCTFNVDHILDLIMILSQSRKPPIITFKFSKMSSLWSLGFHSPWRFLRIKDLSFTFPEQYVNPFFGVIIQPHIGWWLVTEEMILHIRTSPNVNMMTRFYSRCCMSKILWIMEISSFTL